MKNRTAGIRFAILTALLACHLLSVTAQTFPGDPMPDIPIPDDACYLNQFAVDEIAVSGVSGTLGNDVFLTKVCINITHTAVGDLEVILEGPDGTEVELVDEEGGSGDNYVNTCFSMQSDQEIDDGEPPFTGTFLPYDDFDDFNGLSPNGDWTLKVCDDASGETGTLDSWEIIFADELCEAPHSINIILGLGSVFVNWEGIGPASGYVLEYGPDGFTEGTGTFLSTTDTFVVIDGLMSLTDYDLYVSTVCDGDTTGASKFNFVSSCDAISGGYFEPFIELGTYAFPDCWFSYEGGVTIGEGPINQRNTRWTVSIFGQLPGETPGLSNAIFVEDEIDWIVSPFIDISDGDYELSFDMALNAYYCNWCLFGGDTTTLFADDSIGVAITVDTGKTWQPIMVWDSSDFISPFGDHVLYDLSMYSGTVQFGFFATDGSVYDPDQRNWSIDNFRVIRATGCDYPLDLSVSDNALDGASLHWEELSGATEWELEIGEKDFARTGVPTHTTTDNPFLWDGGEEGTEYDFYVRSVCYPDTSSGWNGPENICTLLDTFFLNFDDIYPEIPDCWSSLTYAFTPLARSYFGFYAFNSVGLIFEKDLDVNGYILAILPDFYYHPGSDYTIEFRIRGDFDLELGYITNPLDTGTFVVVDTIVVGTDFNEITIADTFSMGRIGLRAMTGGSSYDDTAIDDLRRSRTGGGSPCEMNLNISGTPSSGTYNAQISISSDATILAGRNVGYEAGDEVNLTENFEVQPGATFEATDGVPCPD